MAVKRKRIEGLLFAAVLGLWLMLSAMSLPQSAAAGDDIRVDCNVIGENLLTCNDRPLYGFPTIIIYYDPPFSEKHGGCGGQAEDINEDEGMFTFVVRNSWGGCPLEVGDRVTFTTDPFFVTPESPIGTIAMLLASMGALGGFFYLRMVRKPTGIA